MARPASHFKRIIEQVQKDILKITTVNGYVTEFPADSVHLLPKEWKSLRIFPHCFITYNGNTVTELQNSQGSKVTKRLILIFFLKDSRVKPTILQLADLETDLNWLWKTNNPTLKEDLTGTELVTKIKMTSDSAFKVAGEPFEVWTTDIEVTYHQRWDI
jgi:hypothetical protein